jgi:hypothetical protein
MESQLAGKTELPQRLPADPGAAVPDDIASALQGGGCYAAWQTEHHLTYVWFEGGGFRAEVWVNGQPQEIIAGDSLPDVRENVELFYGGDLE